MAIFSLNFCNDLKANVLKKKYGVALQMKKKLSKIKLTGKFDKISIVRIYLLVI